MITTEWCTTRASSAALEAFYGSDLHAEEKANLCEALTIAARVLDEGAVERLAQAFYLSWSGHHDYVPWVPGGNSFKQDDARAHARAVLAYLKGEK